MGSSTAISNRPTFCWQGAEAARRAGDETFDPQGTIGPTTPPPGQAATPKVTDFGIAKQLAAGPGETRAGDVIGTPSYMAPEQASGSGEVGPAADIYSLGVVLYEMLTGRVPLQGPTPLDTLILVRTAEPVPPRRLQPGIAKDLEVICLKCLEKEPARRYATAEQLAEDLGRFLSDKPILARPTPAWERAWKGARRYPAVAALSIAVVLIASLGFSLVAWQWQRAEGKAEDAASAQTAAQRSEEQEKTTRRKLEQLSAGMSINQGGSLCEAGEVSRGMLWYARALELATNAQDPDLVRTARYNLATWQPYLTRRRAELWHAGWVWAIAVDLRGRTVLSGGSDGFARSWDPRTGRLVQEFPP